MRFSAAVTAERLLPERLALLARPLAGRIDAVLSTADESGEARRMSLIAFAIRMVSAAIAFVSQVLLARWMGGFEYGIFVLVWVAVVIVGNFGCLGFHTSVIRFIPEYREKGLLPELRGILFGSRIFVLLASTALAAAGLLGIWLLSGRIEPYYVAPFALGAICLPMIAMSDVLEGIARAHSWAITALAPGYLLRPVLILVFMAGAVALGYPPTADTAVIAAVAATYLTTLVQLAVVTARAERSLPAGPRHMELKPWVAVSLPIFLIEGFFFLLTNADVLMVGFFLPPQDVAVYYATVKTLALVHFVYFAVKAGVAQRYAQYMHTDRARLAAFARETASWTFWPSLMMAALVLLVGRPLLSLFGPGFEAGYPLLFLLCAGVAARAAVGPAESLLTMSGNQNASAVVYGLTLAINVVLSVLLIPVMGLWGAAIAAAVSSLFEAAALSWTVWKRLGIVMAVFLPARTRQEAR